MSETQEATEELPTEEAAAPVIPEHLKEPLEKYNTLRVENAKRLFDLDKMATTDVRLTLAITRLNLAIEKLFGDGEDRLFFELIFEEAAKGTIEDYLSQAIQAKLLQR